MKSSDTLHSLRWPVMGLSLLLVLFCVSLVLADWICRPLLVHDLICSAHQDHHGTALVVLLVGSFIVVMLLLTLVLIHLPGSEPLPRMNQKKLFVDEDQVQYYWWVPGETDVEMINDGSLRSEHLGSSETDARLEVQPDLLVSNRKMFTDTKLRRVQEPGQQNDILPFTRERKHFLLKKANQKEWFELALRFGKELKLSQWREEVHNHPKRKMVKLLGFNGETPMSSPWVNHAIQQLMEYDVVMWDGDWYDVKGWTGMIYTFLLGKPNGTAVAFQKKAQVPGFHRSYWKLYQRFPNRIQIVVLNDVTVQSNGDVCPKQIKRQLDWLETQVEKKILQKPKSLDWVNVSLVAQRFQGQAIPVIAMNGGTTATALAALETGKNPFRRNPWTVYQAWKLESEKEERKPESEKEKTLLEYALQKPKTEDEVLTLHYMPELEPGGKGGVSSTA